MSVIGVDTNGIRNPDNGSPNGRLPSQEGLEPGHTVESGDTLYEIWQQAVADGSDCTWEEFLAANQHIDNPDWIYPGDAVFYPESSGVDGSDGTDGTNGTDGTDGTDGTGGTDGADGTGEDVDAHRSEEAEAVDDAQADYDQAVQNYNAHPSDENWAALDSARQELEGAILTEAEAEVANMNPPPSTYEEYQQAVAEAAQRIAARHPDDPLVQTIVDDVVSEMTSVEYLEAMLEEAQQVPPAQSQAGRIEGL
ncbi:MAG TPA: LysM domain-containing protein, partial [Deinococcales bacterium]|nr:LysM domain-containing protein [Deinococcales bacterium]